MRIEGSRGGGWLQVEFLKCSISEMTNSLFEKADAGRVGKHGGGDGGAGLPLRSTSAGLGLPLFFSLFFHPRSSSVFFFLVGKGLSSKTKGAGTRQDTVAGGGGGGGGGRGGGGVSLLRTI